MRYNNNSPSFSHLRCWLPLAVIICLCLSGVNSGRTARAQQQPAKNSTGQKARTKRLTPLRTSDTADGSRVTITSDGELNDYSAYRSGDRFIVVVPQAEGAGGGDVRGRGFEGAQVERRGKDLVYTFKLQPGATARVNQRFNRLDVQFSAPKDKAKTATANDAAKTPTPAATTNQPNTTPSPQIIANKSATNANAQPTPGARRTPEANANAAAANQPPVVVPSPNAGTLPSPAALPTAAAPTPTLAPTTAPPSDSEQLAQTQATPAAPVSITTSAPSTSSTSFGAVVLRNWPWLIAVLLAIGIGLLFVSRLGRRDEAASPPSPARPETSPVYMREGKTAELKSASAATPLAATVTPAATTAKTTAAVTPAAPAVPLVPSGKQSKKQKKKAAEKAKKLAETGEAKSDSAPVKTDSTTGGAATIGAIIAAVGAAKVEESKKDETKIDVAKAAETKAVESIVAFDPESIEAEIKKLLAGESYDESRIDARDAGTRQLVSSELRSAIAGRNAERKQHARTAFLKHGYFDAATRDLQSAEAPAERASAARTLGLIEDKSATPHLIAALEDPAADVRRTAVEALAELRDPSAVGALEALRWRETSRQVPRALIQRAIEASQPIEEETTEAIDLADDTPTLATASSAATFSLPETQTSDATGTQTQESEVSTATSPLAEESLAAAPDLAEIVTTKTATPEVATVNEEALTIETEDVTVETKALEVAAPFFEPTQPGDEIERAEIDGEIGAVSVVPEASGDEPEAVRAEIDLASTLAAKESNLIKARVHEQGQLSVSNAAEESFAESHIAAAPAVDAPAPIIENVAPVVAVDTPADISEFTIETPAAADTQLSPAALTSAAPAEVMAVSEANVTTPGGEESPQIYYSDFPVNSGKQPAASGNEWIDLDADERARPVSTPIPEASRPAQPTPPGPFFAEDVTGWSSSQTTETPAQTTETPAPPAVAEASQPETAALFESLEVETFESNAAQFVPVEAMPVEVADLSDAPTQPLSAPEWPAAAVADEPHGTGVVKANKGLSVADGSDEEDYSTIPKGIQVRLGSDEASERAASVLALSRLNTDEAFNEICMAFDDSTVEVRTAAARALYDLTEDRADSFTRALREATSERRRQIGAALASSGLADEAISNLTGESRDKTYDAFSLLFLMAKAGEVAPLIHAIESHPDSEVRLAVVKLLALSGQHDILPSFRRLAVRGSLPTEVRSAVMEAIYQISSTPTPTHTT
ncbi:MAG: HEAT repeat domain-containing protein [Pyrinomonadaceae bacterium]